MRLPFACRTLNNHKAKNFSFHTADVLCKDHNRAKKGYELLMELKHKCIKRKNSDNIKYEGYYKPNNHRT